MNSRHSRTPTRSASALIHRGPQAVNAPQYGVPIHAPNAALLIDFDNVTMGIRSDLGKELRSLLSSEIIKGKVAVQRAYADWRRYPQYIVPLSEASIDLIFAPAYGASKKNATDIRLAIDALELVFTRPEIGTFILLSGDSDFSSLVIKLKEYGKYVIGVGIRESSSDLLVQNCDEYYSYNALAGLVKTSEEDQAAHKYDPWELVTEAVQRMKRNNDVMRSDRLKQVMQEIDSTFDEKNLGISKFSRFCQEAAHRGLLSVTKLDNGQLEVDIPSVTPATTTESQMPRDEAEAPVGEAGTAEEREAREEREGREERGRRSRRGRGGRGRDRGERGERPDRGPREAPPGAPVAAAPSPVAVPAEILVDRPAALELASEPARATPADTAGGSGERLTRAEAFDLVRRTVEDLVRGDESVRASEVRRRARQLLGRDSDSLSDRMFVRILKDAHDENIIDLRRRGDDFEVGRALDAASVADQVAKNERAAAAAAAPAIPATPQPRLGMGPRGGGARGAGGRGRLGAPPPELLSVGIVEEPMAVSTASAPAVPAADNGGSPAAAPKSGAKRGRGGRGRGGAKKTAAPIAAAEPGTPAPAVKAAKRGSRGGAKKGTRARAKKGAVAAGDE
ncbi:MAG TPA: NYN domain-containing protein [Gemmatimonadaceae bacterium]|jgi:uncharacterized protein (TIGR00288 family)|nr:NYN domain-containing protein [Gemmatimonadaceae bacterium]